MNFLAYEAQRLVVEQALTGFLGGSSRTGIIRMLCLAAAFFVFLAIGFGALAAGLWLESHYAPDVAAALGAGLCLAVGAAFAGLALLGVSIRRREIARVRQEITDIIHAALDFAEEEIREPVQENPKTAVLLASAAGFIAGEKLH